MTLDSTVLLYTYISRFSVNPQHQQKRKIRQSCYHKFYPPTAFHCIFQLLPQTAHVCFRRRKQVHTPPQPLTAHTRAYTAKHGHFRWGRYHYHRSVPHVSETLRGQVSERQTLPLWGLGRRRSRRTQRACGTAMRSCASLFRGVAAPLGCAVLMPLFVQYDLERWKDLTKRSGRVTITRNDWAASRLALVWEPL